MQGVYCSNEYYLSFETPKRGIQTVNHTVDTVLGNSVSGNKQEIELEENWLLSSSGRF